MDLIETNSNYIVTNGSKSIYFDRITGKASIREASAVSGEWNPVCLGQVDGVIGKIRYDPDSYWRLFLIRNSELVGKLPDGMDIYRITRVVALPLSTQPVPELDLKPCTRKHAGVEKRNSLGATVNYGQKPLIGQMRRHLRNAAGTVDSKLTHERQRDKYERRMHEELSRLLHMEEEAFFYFSPGGGDVTSWTQRKFASSYWTGLSVPDSIDSDSSDSNWAPRARLSWRQPVWRRADTRFFWNSHMLAEVIKDADRILTAQGFPAYGSEPSSVVEAGGFEQQVSDLEGLITPIVQGYVEMEKLSLLPTTAPSPKHAYPNATGNIPSSNPQTDQRSVTVYYSTTSCNPNLGETGSVVFHGLDGSPPVVPTVPSPNLSLSDYPDSKDLGLSSRLDDISELPTSQATITEPIDAEKPAEQPSQTLHLLDSTKPGQNPGDITVILFSRRSRFRAGTRYRRRGIDNEGHVANYVETEQILQTHTVDSPQTVAFLQIRGSVPLFWTQTGLKYRPPINLEKNDVENQAAFDRHWQDLLTTFRQVMVVSLLDTGPKRSENVLSEAYQRHLLLYNHPQLTCVTFDFHDYCRNLHFENASVLLAGIMHLLTGMKFCWVSEQGLLCKQRWIFRVNCLDCLDRTNVVQCLFAEIAMATQLKKFGILGPDDHLPVSFIRAMQRIWANNGDAISQQYAGTIAMKGDYTRTGERTMNGMMRDGVSSMNRYYLRFRELARQAAIDLLLGQDDSPELVLFRSGAGLKAASLQVREENIKIFINRCREMLLKPEEMGLSESLLTTYSELNFDPQIVNTVLIVTDQYLHFIRLDAPSRSRRPTYVRIPVSAIARLEIGLQPSVFRAKHHVIRVFYTPPPNETQPIAMTEPPPTQLVGLAQIKSLNRTGLESRVKTLARSNPELYEIDATRSPIHLRKQSTSDVEQLATEDQETILQNDFVHPQVDGITPVIRSSVIESAMTTTETTKTTTDNTTTTTGTSVTSNAVEAKPSSGSDQQPRRSIRFPRPGSSAQHFLAFMQPNVRLFNTVLVPVPPGDETVQSLNVVGAMILVAIRSRNGTAELIEYPPTVKLERLRQAAIPQAYSPEVNVDGLFENLTLDGWTRVGSTTRRKKRAEADRDKCAEPDAQQLSSDAAEQSESRSRSGFAGPDMSSRVDRLRQRLNQIKLPEFRIRLSRRQAPASDSTNIAQSETLTENNVPTTDSSAVVQSTAVEERALSQPATQGEPSGLLQGLVRFVQRPLVSAPKEPQPSVQDVPDQLEPVHSDASISSDADSPRISRNMEPVATNGRKSLAIPAPSDWSHSENDIVADEEEETDQDRCYADDEEDEDDDGVDDDEDILDEEDEDEDGLIAVPDANLPTETEQSIPNTHEAYHFRVLHHRSLSDAHTLQQSVDEDSRQAKLSIQGDISSAKSAHSTRVSQLVAESQGSRSRNSLPKLFPDKRHRLMYERISSITGKAWQSGALSQRDWQSELSLNTSMLSPDHRDGSGPPNTNSFKPDTVAPSSPSVTAPAQSTVNEQASAEACASQYSLVRSDNMPEIVLDNVRDVERLRKKQLASLIRLDTIRNDTCPEQTVLTRFLIF